jgi:hypothetical protein
MEGRVHGSASNQAPDGKGTKKNVQGKKMVEERSGGVR